jgi:peptide/nickel transport system substrate-binding protein
MSDYKKGRTAKTAESEVQLNDADQRTLQSLLAGGNPLSRRQALGWLGAMGIGSLAVGSLIGTSSQAFAATAQKGGHLRIAGYAQSAKDTLDPARAVYSNDYMRLTTFYNALTRLDENGNATPDLATEWIANENATQWRFNLRKGVQFHNGKSFGADDVVYTLLRHKDPATGSSAKALLDPVTSVRADGKHSVVIDLNAPNADLPVVLSTYLFVIIADGTTDFSTANGTGPYKVKEFSPGIRSIGERNQNYHRDVWVDSIEHFAITDSIARANALRSGEIDLAVKLDPNTLKDIEASDDASIFRTPCPRFSELVMQIDKAPYDNKDFRNALKWMFDRERLLKTVFKGYGKIANDHIFHPNSEYYNNELEQRNLDIDRAKSLLKKAGMAGATVDLHVSPASTGSVDMGLMLQQSAAQAGLTINLKKEPADGYWSNIWLKRAFFGAEWNARPVYDMNLSLSFLSEGKWNESHIKNETLDSRIHEARATVDPGKRKELYGDVQRIIYDEGGNIIPVFVDYLDGVSNKVKGLKPVPVGNLGGFNFADSVWMES